MSPKTMGIAITTNYKVKYKQICIFNVLTYQTASKFLQKCKFGYSKLFQDSL